MNPVQCAVILILIDAAGFIDKKARHCRAFLYVLLNQKIVDASLKKVTATFYKQSNNWQASSGHCKSKNNRHPRMLLSGPSE
jgi:hypothetical protein